MASLRTVSSRSLSLRTLRPAPLPHLACLSQAASTAPVAQLTRSTELEGLTYLELNRPQAKNALSVELVDRMRQLVEDVRFDGCVFFSANRCCPELAPLTIYIRGRIHRWTRTLILHSTAPGSFCAGADLKERKGMQPLEVARFLYNLRRLLSEIESLPLPTIAAVDGPALGGGLELALACDLRVAGELFSSAPRFRRRADVPFLLRFLRDQDWSSGNAVGYHPRVSLRKVLLFRGQRSTHNVFLGCSAGGTQRLSRLVGASRAKDLIFSSRIMAASEALERGAASLSSNAHIEILA